jgi:purine-binding chemotaxis protein CheW
LTLHVVFVLAGVEYALPVGFVLQMDSFNGATAVPGTPAYVAGIVTVRGRVVPVIDLRRRFGLPAVPATLDTRIIVTQVDERVVGLCVDRAREVLPLDPTKHQPAPAIVTERSLGLVHGVHAAGSRLLLLLDLSKVLSESAHDDEPHALLADDLHGRPALPG